MSVRDAAKIINSREKKEDEEEMKLFDEVVQKSYSIKLNSMRKKTTKIIYLVLLFSNYWTKMKLRT